MKFVDIHQQKNITLHLCLNHKNYNIFWGGKGYGVAQWLKNLARYVRVVDLNPGTCANFRPQVPTKLEMVPDPT